MHIQRIAHRLTELLRDKKFMEAQKELYHENILSVEPDGHPAPRTNGKAQLLEKEILFLKGIQEWREFEISEPLIAKDYFSLRMYTNVILKNGQNVKIDEIVVYEVIDGKIIGEHYFYRR